MEKGMKNNSRRLTELEIMQLKEQRNKIIINAAMATAGTIDLTLLKLLSGTLGTDDMTAIDLMLLLLGGGSSFLGLTLMTTNAIDYKDMKNSFYKKENSKKKIRKK